ncbi:hypothetical protein M011DRAFT_412584 [Sporormia fimetaria CBS 119925]|uniref:Uncharacterized protein n=1 Tax=Sporormia fimetaria CBS 119925 TaxID=1340428 RepID=A0A6A6UXL8_9PLEO|nr:hypothetical protein M011DRAFT_412584 [Sporormia fimetaria CBS 119925]
MFNVQSIVLMVICYVVLPRLTFLPPHIHSLLVSFGPITLTYCVNAFNKSRAASRSIPTRPTPRRVQYALDILLVSAVVCLALSLPHFSPENVFLKTQSRLQIQANVLFSRLALLRPLTEDDEVLRSKFVNTENKLLYMVFGPDTVINCIWCKGRDDYLMYSLAKILKPHILHLVILGLATSSFVGKETSRFRTQATLAGLALMVTEVLHLATYDMSTIKLAKTVQEIDFVHWRVRVYRFLAFAAVDGVFGLVLWLTSTNRWLAKPPPVAERLEMATREAESSVSSMHALGLLLNSINRDQELRNLREVYWRRESQENAEVLQEEEVVAQINQALSRMNVRDVEKQIEGVIDGLLHDLGNLPGSQPQSSEE